MMSIRRNWHKFEKYKLYKRRFHEAYDMYFRKRYERAIRMVAPLIFKLDSRLKRRKEKFMFLFEYNYKQIAALIFKNGNFEFVNKKQNQSLVKALAKALLTRIDILIEKFYRSTFERR